MYQKTKPRGDRNSLTNLNIIWWKTFNILTSLFIVDLIVATNLFFIQPKKLFQASGFLISMDAISRLKFIILRLNKIRGQVFLDGGE